MPPAGVLPAFCASAGWSSCSSLPAETVPVLEMEFMLIRSACRTRRKRNCTVPIGAALMVFLAGLLAASPVAAKTVTAKGFSFYEPGREMIAREKALDEAKRAAIEAAMGTAVESRTVVENFEVVKDQIFSRSAGYLKDLQIIDETKTDLGTYEVTIQADVQIPALIDDLDRFRDMIRWQKNPRISIGLEPAMPADVMPAALKSVNLLTEKLKKNGFKVFRRKQAPDVQMGFLVALSLEMSTHQTKYQGIELTLNEVGLTSNIYRPGDGEILAAASAVKSIPGENRLQILDKGARACVDAVWGKLREKLLLLWEKELYSEREVFLVIHAVDSNARAHEIAGILQSDVSGILGADVVRFEGNTAELSVRYRGWPEQLLNEMQLSYFKNRYFDSQLESMAGNKLVIRIQ